MEIGKEEQTIVIEPLEVPVPSVVDIPAEREPEEVPAEREKIKKPAAVPA